MANDPFSPRVNSCDLSIPSRLNDTESTPAPRNSLAAASSRSTPLVTVFTDGICALASLRYSKKLPIVSTSPPEREA